MRTFQFTVREFLEADFTRFRENYAPEVVGRRKDREHLLGDVYFPLIDLITSSGLPVDSEEVIRFLGGLRAEPGYAALTALSTPDYAIAIALSLPDALLQRRSPQPLNIHINTSFSVVMREFNRDMQRMKDYCVAAGLMRAYRAKNPWAKTRLYITRSFWP